jgi:CheY-like chemotaxis protein
MNLYARQPAHTSFALTCRQPTSMSGLEHRVLTMMGEGKFEKADVDLLDVNGYELAPVLRERARTAMLRLIALTRSREHEDRELARTAGFERYLLKPVAALDLSNLLEMPGSPAR